MDKPNTVSNDAKIKLYEQQIALLDVIADATSEHQTAWEQYVDSTFPNLTITEGKIEVLPSTNVALTHMRHFRDSVFSGVTPSAEVLALVAASFDKYLNDFSGTLTLDESFSLSHKSRVGSPLKQEKWLHKKITILLAMWLERKLAELNGYKLSIENAAAKITEDWGLDADPESLKKEYIRYKLDQQNEGYFPAIPEVFKDLEKGLRDAKAIYYSDELLQPKSVFSIFSDTNTLRKILEDFKANLGKK